MFNFKNSNKMKKAFIFVSAIVLAGFMLTSCGGEK